MVKHVHAKEVIERVLGAGVSQAQVARALKAPAALVYQWTRGLRPIAAKHAIPLEELSGGAVTRHEIAPDVFGEAANDHSG